MLKIGSAFILASIVLGAAPATAVTPTSVYCPQTGQTKGGTTTPLSSPSKICNQPRDAGAFKL